VSTKPTAERGGFDKSFTRGFLIFAVFAPGAVFFDVVLFNRPDIRTAIIAVVCTFVTAAIVWCIALALWLQDHPDRLR
jgi:hypothetical protein